MVGPEFPTPQVSGTLQMMLCIPKKAQLKVCLPEGLLNSGLDQRLRCKLAFNSRSSAIECSAYFQIWVRLGVWSRLLICTGLRNQIVTQEVVHRPSLSLGSDGTHGHPDANHYTHNQHSRKR